MGYEYKKLSFLLVPLILISCSKKPELSTPTNSQVKTPKYAVLFPMALPFCFMLKVQDGIVGYPGMNRKAIPFLPVILS